MKEILFSDWLPEGRWRFPASVRQEKSPLFGDILNRSLSKLFLFRWLDIGLPPFCVFIYLDFVSAINTQKPTWPISSHLDLTLDKQHNAYVIPFINHYHTIKA